jgi:hypothetical protein
MADSLTFQDIILSRSEKGPYTYQEASVCDYDFGFEDVMAFSQVGEDCHKGWP